MEKNLSGAQWPAPPFHNPTQLHLLTKNTPGESHLSYPSHSPTQAEESIRVRQATTIQYTEQQSLRRLAEDEEEEQYLRPDMDSAGLEPKGDIRASAP